jgi:transcriptional regulator with XRE-family HTH domain
MSQRDLAKVMKTSQQQIQRMEKGQPISLETAVKFAKIFNVEVGDLLVKDPASKLKKQDNKDLIDALTVALFEAMANACDDIVRRVFFDTGERLCEHAVLNAVNDWLKAMKDHDHEVLSK